MLKQQNAIYANSVIFSVTHNVILRVAIVLVVPLSCKHSEQVPHMHMPLLWSSIIWYWSEGGAERSIGSCGDGPRKEAPFLSLPLTQSLLSLRYFSPSPVLHFLSFLTTSVLPLPSSHRMARNPTTGSGECCKLFSGVPGQAPLAAAFPWYFERREHVWCQLITTNQLECILFREQEGRAI